VPVEEPSTASLAEIGLERLSFPPLLSTQISRAYPWGMDVLTLSGLFAVRPMWPPALDPVCRSFRSSTWGAVSIYHLLDLTADSNLIPTDVSEDNGWLENIMNGMSAPQRRRRW
jgi:hypothetical protein